MSHALHPDERSYIIAMNAADALEALKVAGGLAGGAFGVKLFDWFTMRKRERKQQSGEWQVRVIDAGEHMREERTAEAKMLRAESSVHLERAHRAEIENVTLRNENTTLRSRLDRKDEQYKVLVRQLFRLGQLPVTMEDNQERPSDGVTVQRGDGLREDV